MSKDCKCSNVTLYDDGWQCVLCGDKFIPRPAPLTAEDIVLLKEALGNELQRIINGEEHG